MESEYLYQSSLAYMGSLAALYSHPDADIEKGSTEINKQFYNALGRIPFLTEGKTGDDMLNEARLESVKRYKQLQANMTPKKKDGST